MDENLPILKPQKPDRRLLATQMHQKVTVLVRQLMLGLGGYDLVREFYYNRK